MAIDRGKFVGTLPYSIDNGHIRLEAGDLAYDENGWHLLLYGKDTKERFKTLSQAIEAYSNHIGKIQVEKYKENVKQIKESVENYRFEGRPTGRYDSWTGEEIWEYPTEMGG